MYNIDKSPEREVKTMNPIAIFYMSSGNKIVVELLPEAAPNTVNSFIYCAKQGCLDGHAIQRIVPGKWVDLTYAAFHKEECKYLIPLESMLHPEIEPLDSHPGCICMGGYGVNGMAGCEPFFTLSDQPTHKGIYPVFGYVREGMEELYRLEKVPTRPVKLESINMEVNEPLEPEIIERVELELFGVEYPDPIRMPIQRLPGTWK